MTDELKPVRCGCGGKPVVGHIEKTSYLPKDRWYIGCPKCDICTGLYDTEAEAVKAWNLAMGAKEPSAEPERKIIRCEDCIYFDPAHVEKDGLRYEYKDMPEEAYGLFGTHDCVTVKYGINVSSRCTYEQDNRVFRQRNDFCSRAEMRGDR